MRARAGAAALVLLGVLAGPVQAADEPVQEQVPVATEAVVADAVPADEVATDAAPSPAAEPVDDALPLLANASLESAATPLPEGTRSGLEIYRKFREGLAEPDCQPGASARWRAHFANAPTQLASPGSDVLPLFGYVVDRLRDAHLPTEFALIPFVESGFRPGARSPQGPAGLWQFIALTARNHKVPVQAGYDGRLSPADSTDAAVRYLKTLHGMFAGDWRLAVMAYNAGEYRLLGALRRAGQRPADTDPDSLPMPSITKAYVRKLRALSCLLEEAEDREAWLQALDRPVPVLTVAEVPASIATLEALARRHGADAARLQRLNPVFASGRLTRPGGRPRVLLSAAPAASLLAAHPPASPAAAPRAVDDLSDAMADASAHVEAAPAAPRSHVVARGDSAWRIANRYDVRLDELLERNGLDARTTLRPGMVLAIDAAPATDTATAVAE